MTTTCAVPECDDGWTAIHPFVLYPSDRDDVLILPLCTGHAARFMVRRHAFDVDVVKLPLERAS